MRGYKTLIQEAELMAMAPPEVAEFLKGQTEQSKDAVQDDQIDEETEKALRRRGDPLIDLSLARYGRHLGVVSELFRSAGANSPIRLACLANSSLGKVVFRSFPAELFGREPRHMLEWFLTATDDELCALFENPNLADSFLEAFLERTGSWSTFPDDRLCRIVSILHRNPRMRMPRDDDYMDGFAEHSYNSVFDAAWKLAGTAPVTHDWALALGWLYEQLHPNAFSIEEPLKLAQRWHIDPADSEANERQTKDHEIGYLGTMERVRKGLARLALSKSDKLLADLLASDDLAFRAAAYSAGKLSEDQLHESYQKDGEIVFTEAIGNLQLWRRQGTRQALHTIAWSVVRNDKHSELTAANRYIWMEKDLRTKHPSWFVDAEDRTDGDAGVDDQSPATRADISALAKRMDRQAEGDAITGQSIRGLMSRTGWIWWFSLGAFAASVWHF